MLSEFATRFRETLVTALVISVCIGPSSASSVAALAVALAYGIAEKYFSLTVWDKRTAEIGSQIKAVRADTGTEITAIRADFAKIKAKQDQADLKGAFGAKSG